MSERPLFEFSLWPAADVLPWKDDAGRPFLNWFGLTDGWYTINCGEFQLFRYTQDYMDSTPQHDWRTPYFDYQVARLHHDVLEILPHAMAPMPADLAILIKTRAKYAEFLDRFERFAEEFSNFPATILLAERWRQRRCLNRGHLPGQPQIMIWRESDTIWIRWLNDMEADESTGWLPNDVDDGIYSLAATEFLDEVRAFHDRLMAAMHERVDLAQSGWPNPEISINLRQLVRDQKNQKQSLDRALQQASATRPDWDGVRYAVSQIARLIGP